LKNIELEHKNFLMNYELISYLLKVSNLREKLI